MGYLHWWVPGAFQHQIFETVFSVPVFLAAQLMCFALMPLDWIRAGFGYRTAAPSPGMGRKERRDGWMKEELKKGRNPELDPEAIDDDVERSMRRIASKMTKKLKKGLCLQARGEHEGNPAGDDWTESFVMMSIEIEADGEKTSESEYETPDEDESDYDEDEESGKCGARAWRGRRRRRGGSQAELSGGAAARGPREDDRRRARGGVKGTAPLLLLFFGDEGRALYVCAYSRGSFFVTKVLRRELISLPNVPSVSTGWYLAGSLNVDVFSLDLLYQYRLGTSSSDLGLVLRSAHFLGASPPRVAAAATLTSPRPDLRPYPGEPWR